MTKYIEILFLGPPNPELAMQMVEILDDQGNKIEVGQYYHDGKFWRYQIPVELVPRMVLPETVTMFVPGEFHTSAPAVMGSIENFPRQGVGESLAAKRHRELKEKVASAPPKPGRQQAPVAQSESAAPSDWEACPSCKKKFNPRENDLQTCPQCGEDKCTAFCLTNPTRPCLDCQALEADPEEGGFDNQAAPAGVFQSGFSAAAVRAAEAKGLGERSPDGDDEE